MIVQRHKSGTINNGTFSKEPRCENSMLRTHFLQKKLFIHSSGQGVINSEIMRCLVNHTKMLEGVTRELRLELSLYHQKRNSRKSTQKKQVTSISWLLAG